MKKRYYTNFSGLDKYLSGQSFNIWVEEDIKDSHVIICADESEIIKEDEGLYRVPKHILGLEFEIKPHWNMYKINS